MYLCKDKCGCWRSKYCVQAWVWLKFAPADRTESSHLKATDISTLYFHFTYMKTVHKLFGMFFTIVCGATCMKEIVFDSVLKLHKNSYEWMSTDFVGTLLTPSILFDKKTHAYITIDSKSGVLKCVFSFFSSIRIDHHAKFGMRPKQLNFK